ncbi:ketopantoate reductase family protein [Glacieibacterium megasporae]|uniref:ketopantoate reductase family protein n=1 Tax=Glacieibacterium megasporae TaxID=2835787 RepID=UPI001C1DE8F6|nr:2-dehydropantoate 2-reductase N-terminal domain-containing protein [Polymorphobacter megasporae]UAJ08771.1 NAD(P)-binding domain-containing protein [Polymorphobacter megasporae]
MPAPSASVPSSLRIAIVGAGQIGSTFARQLARAGHDVAVVARPGSVRLAQLQRDGAIVDSGGGRAGVRVFDRLDATIAYDLVIVTLLAHQVDAVIPDLQRSAAACVQFMGNMFDPDRLRHAIGAERCAFGMPFVQAMLDGNGRLTATIGAGGQKTIIGRHESVDVFNAADLPAVLEPDMPLWLRCHAPLCIAFQSISIAGVRRNGGASWTEALVLARGVHACFALIERLGFPVYPRSKRLMARSPAAGLAAVLWAMSRIRSFRDLLATGKSECVALVDMIAAAGAGIAAPDLVARIVAMKPGG